MYNKASEWFHRSVPLYKSFAVSTKPGKAFKNKLAEWAQQEQIKRWWGIGFVLKYVLYSVYRAMSLAWGRVLLFKANQHIYIKFKLGL